MGKSTGWQRHVDRQTRRRRPRIQSVDGTPSRRSLTIFLKHTHKNHHKTYIKKKTDYFFFLVNYYEIISNYIYFFFACRVYTILDCDGSSARIRIGFSTLILRHATDSFHEKKRKTFREKERKKKEKKNDNNNLETKTHSTELNRSPVKEYK